MPFKPVGSGVAMNDLEKLVDEIEWGTPLAFPARTNTGQRQ